MPLRASCGQDAVQRPLQFKQAAEENALFRVVHARSASQLFWLGRISSAHLGARRREAEVGSALRIEPARHSFVNWSLFQPKPSQLCIPLPKKLFLLQNHHKMRWFWLLKKSAACSRAQRSAYSRSGAESLE